MAKKTLGYVELQWTCPSCGTKNPGSQRTCQSCGLPQPDNVAFEQPAQEQLVKADEKIAEAEAGPDVHCRYCGARNPAGAKTCRQCGADLTEGAKREAGRVLGQHRRQPAAPITCPACGAPNAPDAPKCAQCGASLAQPKAEPAKPPLPAPRASNVGWIALIILGVVIAACVAFMFLSTSTEAVTGTVSSATWSRTIVIEGLAPVEHRAWDDEIPSHAVVGTCQEQVRTVTDNPVPGSREVCGAPYTVDTGSGYGQVVQDCEYQVYDDYCAYTVDEWRPIDEAVVRGNDLAPEWPALSLGPNKRAGERTESYQIIFNTEQGQFVYRSSNPAIYRQFQPGSRWQLNINSFGNITEVEPLN